MEAKEKNKEKSIALTMVILIVLIIVMFLLIRCLEKIENNQKIPTGNIDIFDIVFGECTSDEKCKCDDSKKDNNTSSNDDTQSQINSEVVVYDKDKKYSNNTQLNIFTQASYYVLNGVIAPESENTYQFIIRNNNAFNIEYDIEIVEENKYNINMKYRLKANGKYVVGSDNTYVSANELNQYNQKLQSKNYTVYTLDWKWVESENDTQIGTNVEANYKLELKMLASQY